MQSRNSRDKNINASHTNIVFAGEYFVLKTQHKYDFPYAEIKFMHRLETPMTKSINTSQHQYLFLPANIFIKNTKLS